MEKIMLFIFTFIVLFSSCEKREDTDINTYKLEIRCEGNIVGFQTNFYISNEIGYGGAVLYNQWHESIDSPHSFTEEEIANELNTFYSTFSGKGPSLFTFGGTAYKFKRKQEPVDSIKLNIRGYINNLLIVDTFHVFRSFEEEDAVKYQDSIQKQNNFQLVVSKFYKSIF